MALNPLSSNITPDSVRATVTEARRLIVAQSPAIRVLLGLVVLAGVGAIFYLAGQPFTSASRKLLASGREFNHDEQLRVRKILEGRVDFEFDAQRRVLVPADQYETANNLLLKVDFGSRSLEELRNELTVTNVFESESDKQRRERIAQEKILENLINAIPEVAGSFVKISQSKPSGGLRSTVKYSAFVSVEPKDDAKLQDRTVESIRQILVKYVADLSPDAVTVMDRKGTTNYLADGLFPQVSSRERAREEQIRQDVFEKLDWIKGVRVSVHLTSPAHAEARPASAAEEPRWTRKETRKTQKSPATSRRPISVANQPIDLDSLEPPVEEPVAEAVPPSPRMGETSTQAPAKEQPQPIGKIDVEVPRSFYYNNYMIGSSGKEPSLEAIRPSMTQVDSRIRESVKMLLPGSADAWEVKVGMIFDEIPLVPKQAIAPSPQTRNEILGWEMIGAAVTLAVAAIAASMFRLGRRTESRATTIHGSRRFHRDSASDPAPSERVRELVRRNPQAAASVLQRWVGQGREVA